MKITEDIKYIGVNDHDIDLFEGQYTVPNGMSYNSYLILDEKTAVMDSVDIRFGGEWLSNISAELGDKAPDYFIVQHMEPDHSASIDLFMKKYPYAKIVATQKAFTMMGQFFGTEYEDRRLVVTEGDTLSLGKRTLTFVTAPMVHWPEVMFTYTDGVLFSADAFGKFGALDIEEDWTDEARRYYIGIVGKYGAQVQAVLKKASGLDISTICPLHGPVLNEDLGYYIDLYKAWSSYASETDGVMIAYTSIYGHTKAAVEKLQVELKNRGCDRVAVYDLARADLAEAVGSAFRYGKLILATTTYNGSIFPFMRNFLEHLVERGYKNRKIGFIENGSWASTAAKVMRGMTDTLKDIEYCDTTVSIKSALNTDSEAQLLALADEISK